MTMNVLIGLFVLQVFLTYAYDFICPSQPHWNLRAKLMCMDQRNYSCLFDVHLQVNVYRDKCIRPRIVGPGYKYVFQPNPNRDSCSLSRYQPYIFNTTGYSECVLKKLPCSSEGQKTHTDGSTRSDRTCTCKQEIGYNFVSSPQNECYCNPSSEDCSCYLGIYPNKTLNECKGVSTYTEININLINLHGDKLNNSMALTNKDFDNLKYNIAGRTNGYSAKAVIYVLILVLSYSVAVVIYVLHRTIRQWKNTAPQSFDIVECSDHSMSVKWDITYSANNCMYHLDHRIQGSNEWQNVQISNDNVSTNENGHYMYTLQQLLHDKWYEVRMCSVHETVKSEYTAIMTKKTLTIALPKVLNQLKEGDRSRFNKLMESSETGRRFFVKIMIVGKEEVGKTCLLKRLLGDTIPEVVPRTKGVDIVIRRCKINIQDGKWKFGDQDLSDDIADFIGRQLLERNSMKKEVSKKEAYNANASNYEIGNVEVQNDKTLNSKLKLADRTDADATEEGNRSHPENVSMSTRETKDNASVAVNDALVTNEESPCLAMPQNLKSRVFSTALDINTTLIPYALCGLWDFAGQREFYSTHQAFLTSSAVYLVVADMCEDISKQDLKQCFADFKHVGEYVDFWFDSIHCYQSDDTEEHKATQTKEKKQTDKQGKKTSDPPIIIVFTKKDEYAKNHLEKNAIEQREAELQKQIAEILGKKGTNRHIQNVFFLSNMDKSGEAIDKLRDEISTTAKAMDTWGELMPLKWILLEHLIEINKQNKMNYIKYSEVEEMARHPDISMHDPKDVLLFLRFQHKMGNIIFFNDISDFIILDPKWLVDAFCCLFQDKNDGKLQSHVDYRNFVSYGIISDSLITELFEINGANRFSGNIKTNVIKIMEKFDILVKNCDNGGYIMPSKMPCFTFDELCEPVAKNMNRTSWLCLKFPFLPPSFFNHLCMWFIGIMRYTPTKVIMQNENILALGRGHCIFDIDTFGREKILLTMYTDIIAIQHLSSSNMHSKFGDICSNIRFKLIHEIDKIVKRYQLKIRYDLHFKCSEGYYFEDTMPYQSNLNRDDMFQCGHCNESHKFGDIFLPWMFEASDIGTKRRSVQGKTKKRKKKKTSPKEHKLAMKLSGDKRRGPGRLCEEEVIHPGMYLVVGEHSKLDIHKKTISPEVKLQLTTNTISPKSTETSSTSDSSDVNSFSSDKRRGPGCLCEEEVNHPRAYIVVNEQGELEIRKKTISPEVKLPLTTNTKSTGTSSTSDSSDVNSFTIDKTKGPGRFCEEEVNHLDIHLK